MLGTLKVIELLWFYTQYPDFLIFCFYKIMVCNCNMPVKKMPMKKRGGKGSLVGEGPTGKLKKDVSVYKKRMEALEKARSALKKKRAMKKKGSK